MTLTDQKCQGRQHLWGKMPLGQGGDSSLALRMTGGLGLKMTGRSRMGLLEAEAVKDGVAGLLGSVEDEIDPLAVDVDAFRLVYQLGNIL